MPSHYTVSSAKIASGQTVGVAVDLRGQRLVAVQTPAALTGATLTFQCSDKELGVFAPHFHLSTLAATATVITSVSTSQYIQLPNGKNPVNCFLKLVSGSAEAADREFILYTEPLS